MIHMAHSAHGLARPQSSGSQHHSRPPRLAVDLFLGLAALLLLGLGACTALKPAGTPTPEEPVQWNLDAEAETHYDYLVYMDALRENHLQDAAKALTKVLNAGPEPHLFLEMADLRLRMGQLPAAREALKQGLDRYPGDHPLTTRLAELYRLEKRYDDAALTLETALEKEPQNLDLLHQLAGVRLDQGDFRASLAVLERIPRQDVSARTLTLRAKAQEGLDANRKAEATLRQALQLDAEYLPALVELADLYESEGKYAQAQEIYTKLLEIGETGPEVWLRLVSVSLKLSNLKQAMAFIRLGPDSPAFRLEAARLLMDARHYPEAREVLTPLAMGEDPEPTVFFFLALVAYEGENDPAAALAYLERIPEGSPNYAKALGFRANLLTSLKRYDDALKLLDEARGLAPADPELAELQAVIHQDRGELPEARKILEDALAQGIESPRLSFRLALVLYDMGQPDEALDLAQKYLAADPENAEALNLVGYILADQGRDLDHALKLIQKAVGLAPDNAYIVDSLAWALYRRGELTKAWTEIRRAVSLQDKDPFIWEHYGDIAKATGRKAEARKAYQRALDSGHKDADRISSKIEDL